MLHWWWYVLKVTTSRTTSHHWRITRIFLPYPDWGWLFRFCMGSWITLLLYRRLTRRRHKRLFSRMIYVSIRHLFSNACTFLAFGWWWHLHQFWYLRKLHYVGLTFQGILLCLLQLMYYISRLIELTISIYWLDFMFWHCVILSQLLLMSIDSLLQLR